mgnify:CR=1 FL=1
MAAAGVKDPTALPAHLEAAEPPEARGLTRDAVHIIESLLRPDDVGIELAGGASAGGGYAKELTEADRTASVLPFSFDYGLNQLLTAVLARPSTYEENPRGHLGLVANRATKTLVGAWAVAPLASPSWHTSVRLPKSPPPEGASASE